VQADARAHNGDRPRLTPAEIAAMKARYYEEHGETDW
jgi:hypothetical protein